MTWLAAAQSQVQRKRGPTCAQQDPEIGTVESPNKRLEPLVDHVCPPQLVQSGALVRVPDDCFRHECKSIAGLEHLEGPLEILGDPCAFGNGCSRQTDIRMHEQTLSNAQVRMALGWRQRRELVRCQRADRSRRGSGADPRCQVVGRNPARILARLLARPRAGQRHIVLERLDERREPRTRGGQRVLHDEDRVVGVDGGERQVARIAVIELGRVNSQQPDAVPAKQVERAVGRARIHDRHDRAKPPFLHGDGVEQIREVVPAIECWDHDRDVDPRDHAPAAVRAASSAS